MALSAQKLFAASVMAAAGVGDLMAAVHTHDRNDPSLPRFIVDGDRRYCLRA